MTSNHTLDEPLDAANMAAIAADCAVNGETDHG